jgi:hypothetical protein
VHLHYRFGDVDLSRDAFVGVAFDQALEYQSFPNGKLRRYRGLWPDEGRRFVFVAQHRFAAVLAFGIENE